MERVWERIAAIVALALLGGSSAGAQSPGPDPAWAAVTGTAACTVATPGSAPDRPPPYQVSSAVTTCTETASDPRVTGTSTIVLDIQRFDASSSAGVGWGDYALMGPEGSWAGRQYVIGEATGGSRTTTVSVGDGAYAGWTYARSATVAPDGSLEIVGVLYPGDAPPGFPVTTITGLLPGDDAEPLPLAGESAPPITGTLELGKGRTKPTKATIGPSGGTIAVGQPGEAAAGLTIEVPAGAVAPDTRVTVSSRAIAGHDFGSLLTPLSRLYTVDMGGVMLTSPATVSFSIDVPADARPDSVPMAFTYDPDTGMLSPLTTVGRDATHLVALAPHFSSVLAGLMDTAALPQIADSGFRPGTDDWQFTNYGSYIAPGGHCEGQVLSELWYYVRQRREAGASPLFGLFDNNGAGRTPSLWEDDSDGYRLASVVQQYPVFDLDVYDYLTGWDSVAGTYTLTPPDTQTYNLLRAAIALTGQPQSIAIFAADGSHGHAMLVYMVTPHWLLVADPNYPGRARRIRYDPVAGRLGPFVSGDNAADIAAGNNVVFTRFSLIPSQVRVADATLAARWDEFTAGTIGDGRFPGYALEASLEQDEAGNDVWEPLVDGLTTERASIKIRIGQLSDGTTGVISVYRGDAQLTPNTTYSVQEVALDPGANALGISVGAFLAGSWKYVDFVRLTVTSGPTPSPNPTPSQPAGWDERTIAVINVDVPTTVGRTCPAEVDLVFTPSGKDPMVALWADCTDVPWRAIDALGTFDGSRFDLQEGSRSYTGTFDGTTVTITGPDGLKLVFRLGP